MNEKPDCELVEAASKGDGDSFTELCRRYYPAMVAIADSIIRDKHLAEDAAQQAFAKAATNLPRLKQNDRFAAWLASICRNAARDVASRRKSAPVDYNPTSERFTTDKDDTGQKVREALDRLSDTAREVVYLRFYDGLSYEQISVVLGISQQAINGKLRRAKRKLAEYLKVERYGKVEK